MKMGEPMTKNRVRISGPRDCVRLWKTTLGYRLITNLHIHLGQSLQQ